MYTNKTYQTRKKGFFTCRATNGTNLVVAGDAGVNGIGELVPPGRYI